MVTKRFLKSIAYEVQLNCILSHLPSYFNLIRTSSNQENMHISLRNGVYPYNSWNSRPKT